MRYSTERLPDDVVSDTTAEFGGRYECGERASMGE